LTGYESTEKGFKVEGIEKKLADLGNAFKNRREAKTQRK